VLPQELELVQVRALAQEQGQELAPVLLVECCQLVLELELAQSLLVQEQELESVQLLLLKLKPE
jgi:hypothetical protein